VAIGDVRTAVDPDRGDERVAGRRLKAAIGDEHRLDAETLGRPEHDLFHLAWRRVGVDPHLHAHLRLRRCIADP
jgi:hypothetical protein